MNELETQTQNTEKQAKNSIWGIVKTLILAFLIVAPIRLFVAEPYVVSGLSMTPNFHNSDYLIVERVSYYQREPERGEVIVFKYPRKKDEYFVKRIIGLPGEKVKIGNGEVAIINAEHPEGYVLNETYLPKNLETLGKAETTSLGEGQYYVLGDNRMGSSDSRVWGIVPKENIIGRVWVRVLPFSALGKISTPIY